MADTVSLTIDDKQISVPGGTLVVDAARSAGIQIPVFCSHPKLDPVGVCRMCMVEYVTPRGSRVDVSCTVPVTDGMVVRTDTPAVKAAREAVLGFLLINHPLDCPICDKGGECPLQDQTLQYGPGASKFVEEKNHKAKHYPLSELVILDQERCVLCWRCVRYMGEWEDKPQLGLHKRGDRTFIDVFPGQPLDSKTSGSVIDICPVGALTDRTARFDYRPWELKKTASICTLCPVGCNLRLDERMHELRRIVARENPAVNEDWICDKGRFVRDYVDHPERLKTPLLRENGALRPATWDEALQRVVERLGAVIEAHGAKSAGAVAAAHVSNEAAFLCQKFFRVLLGNNNVDFPSGAAVRAIPTGLPAIDALKQSDLIVLVGLDLSESAPVLDLMIKRAVKRNNARLLILNPRRIQSARYPGAYLPVRPGSAAIALNGLAAWLLAKRAADARQRGSIKPAAQTSGPGAQAEWAWLQAFTPDHVEAGSGVTAATLAAAGELLAGSQRALFLYGPDAGAGARGAATVSALNNLAGLLGRAECVAYIPSEANSQGARDMGLLPNALPGHGSLADAGLRERLGKLWGVQPPAEPGFVYEQMINGAVRALFVMGVNPALDPAAAQALRRLDFLVVQDLFLTETAQLAEVVLPSASFAEADGTYTNLERRVQRAPKGIRAQGESRADWEILAALGQYWQTAQGNQAEGSETAAQAEGSETAAQAEWKRKRKAKPARAGRQAAPAKPWSYSNLAAVSEEIGRVVPFYSGFRWEALGPGGLQWSAGAAPRSARRVEPAQVAPAPAAPAGSFWLASGPILWDGGTITAHSHPQVLKLIPPPFVALNPADLASSKLSEGSEVSVTSPRGSVRLLLRADASTQPGTAWLPLGLAGAPAEMLGAARGEPVAVKIG